MKKWYLFSAIFQIVVGVAAIISYIVLAASGEPLGRWTVTLILAILFVIIGIINLVEWNQANKKN